MRQLFSRSSSSLTSNTTIQILTYLMIINSSLTYQTLKQTVLNILQSSLQTHPPSISTLFHAMGGLSCPLAFLWVQSMDSTTEDQRTESKSGYLFPYSQLLFLGYFQYFLCVGIVSLSPTLLSGLNHYFSIDIKMIFFRLWKYITTKYKLQGWAGQEFLSCLSW